jgi:hypothetical protein
MTCGEEDLKNLVELERELKVFSVFGRVGREVSFQVKRSGSG